MRTMRRVNPDFARRAALIAALLACACKSSAPASSRVTARAPAASEWMGVRGEPREDAPTGAAPASSVQAERDPQAPRDWVLHIGDSFTHAFLRQNLGPRFRAAGARYVVDATRAT